VDIARYRAEWLRAWSEKDVDRLLGFYAPDVVYRDNQTAAGITGHAALRAYLDGLFKATPPMTYEPDQVWPISGGYCGRWYCTIAAGDEAPTCGFDSFLKTSGSRSTRSLHNLPDWGHRQVPTLIALRT
jgi:hypothetical protein